MGENTRRVAKIISFEVSSVNEMIKMDVYLVNTQGYIFLQKKALVGYNPPPPPLSFNSKSCSLISLDTSFLLFSTIYSKYIDNIVCVKEEEE